MDVGGRRRTMVDDFGFGKGGGISGSGVEDFSGFGKVDKSFWMDGPVVGGLAGEEIRRRSLSSEVRGDEVDCWDLGKNRSWEFGIRTTSRTLGVGMSSSTGEVLR